jgi:hypothetical protein
LICFSDDIETKRFQGKCSSLASNYLIRTSFGSKNNFQGQTNVKALSLEFLQVLGNDVDGFDKIIHHHGNFLHDIKIWASQ